MLRYRGGWLFTSPDDECMPSGGRHLRHSVLLTQSDPDLMDNVDDPIRPHKNAVSPQGKGGRKEGGIYRDRRVKGGGLAVQAS